MHVFKIIGLMQKSKSNRFSRLCFKKNRVYFNRKWAGHTSLEIMHNNIGGYFGQRRSISTRKVNVNMFSWKIMIGHLNRPVHQ